MKRDKLRLEPTTDPSTLVIRWEGQLIVGNRQELRQLLWDVDKNVVIDLKETGYIDASGLGVLVNISQRMRHRGKRIVIVGLNDDLLTLFELTKMDTILNVAVDEKAALAILETAPPVSMTVEEVRARKKYDPNDLLTFQEVVDWFGVAPMTVERMQLQWSFPTKGRLRRILFRDVIAHVERRKVG